DLGLLYIHLLGVIQITQELAMIRNLRYIWCFNLIGSIGIVVASPSYANPIPPGFTQNPNGTFTFTGIPNLPPVQPPGNGNGNG
ncbi:MAG TPA: hypothetical protein DEA79_26180, partial [Cyanobacteria bacterium UBA11153]|nr:hypothetical protein [Cyanobacteria bacterium UBA11153]